MATYAIGDIQGMLHPLEQLLKTIGFDPKNDRLWLVGDLVNRGPHSLEVLRLVKSFGDAAITVLGNHDLHLLAAVEKVVAGRRIETLEPILIAHDRDELIEWLAARPLFYAEKDKALVHAGVPAAWSIEQTIAYAEEVAVVLRDHHSRRSFLNQMYGALPDQWDDALEGDGRHRFIINALTRMRGVYPDGRLNFEFDGEPKDMPPDLLHWLDAPGRKSDTHTIYCGHWAAQGYVNRPGMRALDSGCVWRGALTAINVDTGAVFAVSCMS